MQPPAVQRRSCAEACGSAEKSAERLQKPKGGTEGVQRKYRKDVEIKGVQRGIRKNRFLNDN